MESLKSISIGVIIAYAISIIAILVFSVLLVKTNISEICINTVITVISGVSILSGATIASRKIKKKGALNGVIISAVYIVILYAISSVCSRNYQLTSSAIILIITGLILGIVGGVIGVNIKS